MHNNQSFQLSSFTLEIGQYISPSHKFLATRHTKKTSPKINYCEKLGSYSSVLPTRSANKSGVWAYIIPDAGSVLALSLHFYDFSIYNWV
jgi:hypothetical protein